MATPEQIGSILHTLAITFNRPVTPELTKIWVMALADVPTDALTRAGERAVTECQFFPPPAVLRDFAGANQKSPPDVTGILERLRGMCAYDPQWGTTLPSVERVRAELGHAIADAYGFIGPKRLEAVVFGGEGVGADIAGREFAAQLSEAQDAGFDLTLPAPVARPMLAAPNVTLYGERPDAGFKRLALPS